jgi:hypothetical protein
LDRAAKQQQFSVSVVLPASGCEMMAKVRRRKISSVRVLINCVGYCPVPLCLHGIGYDAGAGPATDVLPRGAAS